MCYWQPQLTTLNGCVSQAVLCRGRRDGVLPGTYVDPTLTRLKPDDIDLYRFEKP